MPFVNIKIAAGPEATPERKADLIARVTDALVETLDKKREEINIVIEEVPLENWGYQGRTAAAIRNEAKG